MSLKIHDALNMPEKGFDDVFMASDQRTQRYRLSIT